ncbi:MAG: hypothetical protein H7A36_07270 [Chlamydiales bacterium]|nr:hypothetical protein [Chlamydiales bacterium]
MSFFDLTGAEWITQMRVAEGADIFTPFSHCRAESELMDLLLSPYFSYLKRSPKLYLRPGPSPGQHSVHAAVDIPKGEVVTEYLGEWSHLPALSSSYQWGPINGLHFRNFGGMVEDGFPNLGAFHLYHVRGIPLRVIFVALEDIAQDDMLTIHYGMNHSVKIYFHQEYRLEAMSHFFSASPLEKCVKRIQELKNRGPKELGWKKTLELEDLTCKVRYLFQTPSALMHLLDRKVITRKEAFAFYDQADCRYFFLGFPFSPNRRQEEVIEYMNLIRHCKKPAILLHQIRQRIYFLYYLSGEIDEKEAILWNEAFDAILREDQLACALMFERSTHKRELVRAALHYAKEQNSTLVPWLQCLLLHEPSTPLSPTG